MTQIYTSTTPRQQSMTKFDLQSPDPHQRKINNNLKGIFEEQMLKKKKAQAAMGNGENTLKNSMDALKQSEDNLKSCVAYIMLRVMARFIEKNKALARNEKIDSIDISSFG